MAAIPQSTLLSPPLRRLALQLLLSILKMLLVFIILVFGVILGAAVGFSFRFMSLPDVSRLHYYQPHVRSEILTTQGETVHKIFGEENRKLITLSDLPAYVVNAVLAIEDARFREHKGIDPIGIVRALRNNMAQNSAAEGGSTITQQLTKNLFFTPEKTISRKVAEAAIAIQIDQHYSKNQILELYLNQIYWGHNAYGIEAAAETYFGKSARYLTLAEATLLAGLIRGPEAFSPYRNYKLAKARQSMALARMVQNGFCTHEQAASAKKQPLKLSGIRRGMKYPYFTTYVMSMLKDMYTESELETAGLKIYTTMDPKLQRHAEKLITEEIGSLKDYNVQQGALISLEPRTGYIRAMVGGVDFAKSKFNRAYQAQRQTGSSFKPFIYLTAFANGFTPESVEVDAPVTYSFGPESPTWSPQNYGRSFSGAVTLRRALHNSINVVAVKLMDKVGIAKTIATVKQLGVQSTIQPYLSSALGASEITPLEMVSAYGVFANDGVRLAPTPIVKIVDKTGKVLYDRRKTQGDRVYDAVPIRMLNHVMQGVVEAGTGAAAAIPGRAIAGKTGTTSSHRDAWFVGYTPQLATLVWVGNDTPTVMNGATGGGFCAPIWKKYMEKALEKLPADTFPDRSDSQRLVLAPAVPNGLRVATAVLPQSALKLPYRLHRQPPAQVQPQRTVALRANQPLLKTRQQLRRERRLVALRAYRSQQVALNIVPRPEGRRTGTALQPAVNRRLVAQIPKTYAKTRFQATIPSRRTKKPAR